jgi:hypothetical protein
VVGSEEMDEASDKTDGVREGQEKREENKEITMGGMNLMIVPE